MAATTAFCNSAKQELMKGQHNFTTSTGNTFKIVLIKSGMAGTYGATSTNYSNVTGNSDEQAGGSGYTTGGETLTIASAMPGLTSGVAYADFNDVVLSNATISAAAAMIINSSQSNAAVSIHDFGGTKASTNGTFTITFPTADNSTAIIRVG